MTAGIVVSLVAVAVIAVSFECEVAALVFLALGYSATRLL